MAIAETLLPEFDQEMGNTRKVLERVPDDRFGWKPHEKSFALGALATHLANLPSWTGVTLTQDGIDLATSGRAPEQPNRAGVLATFDANVKAARAALAAQADAVFREPWSLRNGGQTIFSLPKIAVLRSFVMNHMIHHRGQMTVYLRLCGVPLPNLYGPTADEAG